MNRPLYLSLIVFLLIMGACSTKNIIQSPDAEHLIIFPGPPDTARIQFLTYINTSADIEKPPSGFKRFFLGAEKPKPIIRPYGVTISGHKMFVCDPGIRGLEIIDLKEQTFAYFIPTGKGELQMPLNCFVDDTKKLYVADANRRQVVVFDAQGKYLSAFGEAGNFKPIDVAVSADKIYVTNLAGSSFSVFDRDSMKFLDAYPKLSKGEEGFLYKPTSIYVAGNEVYVTDFGEVKIKVYDRQGNYLRSVGSYGRGLGQFVRPKGICVDRDTNLYVVDAAFENVQIFNHEGKLLMYMGRPGNMNLPAGIGINYTDPGIFRDYVYRNYDLQFLIFVTNQFGSNKIGVYGFIKEKK